MENDSAKPPLDEDGNLDFGEYLKQRQREKAYLDDRGGLVEDQVTDFLLRQQQLEADQIFQILEDLARGESDLSRNCFEAIGRQEAMNEFPGKTYDDLTPEEKKKWT